MPVSYTHLDVYKRQGLRQRSALLTSSDRPEVLGVEFRKLPDRSGSPKTAGYTPLRDRLSKKRKPSRGGVIGVALRCYLRYRALQGDGVQALIAAVPTVAGWRHSGLPDTLSTKELSRFLDSFDRRSPSSRRGYAMARCLTDLGLRANEVIHLQLDDLDWREGTIRLAKSKSDVYKRQDQLGAVDDANVYSLLDVAQLGGG